MFKKSLDKLLEMHFRHQPDYSRLDRLEQDVWRRIRARQDDARAARLDDVIGVFAVPQFRLASFALALALSLAISPLFPPPSPAQAFSPAQAMGLDLFSPHAPYLPSTVFENGKNHL
jgi:hypothetical protein